MSIYKKLTRDPRLLRMKNFKQHGSISTYDHVCRVANVSEDINRKFHLNANEEELVRGALLHDYFLYDWHHHDGHFHGYTHPETACQNAERDFNLTEREKNIIRSHMWPLTLTKVPRCKEAWIVCIADKICSTQETIAMRRAAAASV